MPSSHGDLLSGFELGPCSILPERGLVRRDGGEARVEPLVMDVLMVLADNQGRVVSKDELVERVWKGRATTDEVIAAKVSLLRKALGDDPRHPTFIETVQKRGYRLKESVPLRPEPRTQPAQTPGRTKSRKSTWLILALIVAIAFTWYQLRPQGGDIRSVAVLQFRNLSDDKAKFQYVVDGFAEELVVTLGQLPDLRFTRGADSGENRSMLEIADELNVDALVIGSLRTDGSRLRVTAQLVLASGFQVWADSFDAASGDVFTIQERVASEVRNRILDGNGASLDAVSRPATSEAFDTYMLGLFFLSRRDPESLRRALELFGETVALDPGFGPAYLRQAITLLLTARYESGDVDSILDAALEIAGRGAQADPAISEPLQLIHGFVNHERRNWQEAASAYERAMRAHTVYPTAVNWYSLFLGDVGRGEAALAQALNARALEPAAPTLNSRVAIAHLWQGNADEANYYFDIANSLDVGIPDHYFVQAISLLRAGKVEPARDSVATAMQLAQQRDDWVRPLFASLAAPDDAQLRFVALQILDRAASSDTVPVYVPLVLWALFGETERMMEFAHRRADEGAAFKNLELIYQDEFAAFREAPGFVNLLEKLGLTRYWDTIGCRWADDRLACDSG